MDCKNIVFIGDGHTQGVGSEWPLLYGELIATPKEFRENMWINYTRTTDDPVSTIKQKFDNFMSKQRIKPASYTKLRNQGSYTSLIGKHYRKEIVNLGLPVYNFYQIAANLLVSNPTFDDSLVILAVPTLVNDIVYHNPPGSQKFENVTIPYVASTLVLIKEFVEARGGKFAYFHQDSFPTEFYDVKNNPYLYHLHDCRLFDIGLFELCYNKIYKNKIDGIHYDSKAHKIISRKFIEQFENTLIFSILSS